MSSIGPSQKSWRFVCCLCCFGLGDSGVQTLTGVTSCDVPLHTSHLSEWGFLGRGGEV